MFSGIRELFRTKNSDPSPSDLLSGISLDEEFLDELQELAEAAFPKHCQTCGRIYSGPELLPLATVSATESITAPVAEITQKVRLYRRCACGDALHDYFTDRRDMTEMGRKRRERFFAVVSDIQNIGIQAGEARDAVLAFLRGETHPVFQKLGVCLETK